MEKTPRVARRVPFPVTGPCDCAVCAELEQLTDAACWHPAMPVRRVALTILAVFEQVRAGKRGAILPEQCFD